MSSSGPFVFALGVVMVSVIAAEGKTDMTSLTDSTEPNKQNIPTSTTPESDLNSGVPPPRAAEISSPTDISSTTDINSTITPWTSDETSTSSNTGPSTNPTMYSTNPNSTGTTPATPSPTKKEVKDKTTTAKPRRQPDDKTGIIILVVIILVAVGFGVTCYIARRRGRRYSVDFNSRMDEANIPLSNIEPGVRVDTPPVNGPQTFFESAEPIDKQAQEKDEEEEEQIAKADEPSAGSAAAAPSEALAPTPQNSDEKPKEEQKPPATVELDIEDNNNDDEGIVSNKTSVESLKDTNQNNSNNADVTQKKDLKLTNIFWEVSLDSQV